jgi:hypothetical protein
MEERKQLPRSALRYLDGRPRSVWERVQELWFAPKRFESTALYERLGVLLVKKYVPTGGDFFIRRYGLRIVDVRGSLDSLIHFERYTRRLEAIHEGVFLGFVGFSLWRAIVHQITRLDFGFAIVVYIILILSPAMLGITACGSIRSSGAWRHVRCVSSMKMWANYAWQLLRFATLACG